MSRERPLNHRELKFPPEMAVSFDPLAFDDAISAHGVRFIHYRGMRCPVGIIDRDDIRRPADHHEDCSNGFVYTEAGIITCLFIGNTLETQPIDIGMLDGSHVQVTLPRFYDGTQDPVYIANFDRLYLVEDSILVPHWQLTEYNASGIDKLSFPVVQVVDLVDNVGERYSSADFDISNGRIKWTGQHRPGLDPELQRGRVYTVRYLYRPYWYVKQIIHEVRVASVPDPITGERATTRMPQSAHLQREYRFESEERDDDAPTPNSPRQIKRPEDGSWGPR